MFLETREWKRQEKSSEISLTRDAHWILSKGLSSLMTTAPYKIKLWVLLETGIEAQLSVLRDR
jgi:hypothetical protein